MLKPMDFFLVLLLLRSSVIEPALTGLKVFLLFTLLTFNSCCLDEVAAEHFGADSIIHFGHACLSPTSRLPVLYVFGHKEIDVLDCVQKFSSLYSKEDNVVLINDTGYSHVLGIKIFDCYFKFINYFNKKIKLDQICLIYLHFHFR